MKVDYAMKSQSGDREYNEDSVRMKEQDGYWTFALADGLGGCGNGELASGTAVETVFREGRAYEAEDFFDQVFAEAQEAVLNKQIQQPDAKAMSTTMAVLKIGKDKAQWAHIGDSRVYHFRGRKLISLTQDHSVPEMLVKIGEITPDEIRHHPDRNRLLRVIGRAWDDVKYEISEEISVQKGDAFLLCSDGFWEYITEKEMAWTLMTTFSTERWLERMTKIVQKNGADYNMDNYSAICVQIK